MSENHADFSGENHPMYDKPQSEEHRKHNSESHIGLQAAEKHPMYGRIGDKSPWYGKHHTEEAKLKMSDSVMGDKNVNWIDGRSYEPYCPEFNEPLKESIRERDSRICQFPGCGDKETGKRHAVHHIDYNKKNPNADYITLCTKHNTIVNSNRDYWEKYFMNELERRGFVKKRDLEVMLIITSIIFNLSLRTIFHNHIFYSYAALFRIVETLCDCKEALVGSVTA